MNLTFQRSDRNNKAKYKVCEKIIHFTETIDLGIRILRACKFEEAHLYILRKMEHKLEGLERYTCRYGVGNSPDGGEDQCKDALYMRNSKQVSKAEVNRGREQKRTEEMMSEREWEVIFTRTFQVP